jgi:hypothetical protein
MQFGLLRNDNIGIFVRSITNPNKFLPTQRALKGLEAQVIRSKHNLSTHIYVGTLSKSITQHRVY